VPARSSASSEKKWREKEIVKALYLDGSVILVDEERDILDDN
jgi:predicted ribosome quality control (RQC) complex YloA/Tae2 family protein